MEQLTFKEPFQLESGDTLPELTIAYHTFGELNEDKSNVIWVCHALTANSNPVDWWPGLIGKGKLLDPEKYFIVCANMLGSCYGSTGPVSVNPQTGKKYGKDFPIVTVKDMVAAHQLLREHLDLDQIQLCIGGSMGGQQVLEWAVTEPDRFENIVVLASNARHSPWGIAFNEAQRMSILADPSLHNGSPEAGKAGLEAARAIAMLSYRSYYTYQLTQSEKTNDKLDDYLASSYQRYQGRKLEKRFDVFSYLRLSKAMDSHNVGRHRESIEAALQAIKAKALIIGIQSDLLFPVEEQAYIANHIPSAKLEIIDSIYGHDGFLIESVSIASRVNALLNRTIFDTDKSAYRLINGRASGKIKPEGTGKGLGLPGTETF
jgi:homoserine O-acetyltransferase